MLARLAIFITTAVMATACANPCADAQYVVGGMCVIEHDGADAPAPSETQMLLDALQAEVGPIEHELEAHEIALHFHAGNFQVRDDGSRRYGYYDINKGEIHVWTGLGRDQVRFTTIHEGLHFVQHLNGESVHAMQHHENDAFFGGCNALEIVIPKRMMDLSLCSRHDSSVDPLPATQLLVTRPD